MVGRDGDNYLRFSLDPRPFRRFAAGDSQTYFLDTVGVGLDGFDKPLFKLCFRDGNFQAQYPGSLVKPLEMGFEKNLREAIESWKRGIAAYPNSSDLKKRLELASASQDELIQFVKKLRGLEDPVDTDLSRVWVE